MELIKEIDKKTKIELTLLISLIIITIILSIFKINKFIFPLISLSLNILLIIIYNWTKQILKIKFSKLEKIIITSSIIIIYLFYILSIINRNFIYYWDFSCYYNLQITTETNFASGLILGIKSFLGSTWSGEYGNFLAFIPEFIFNLTNKTVNSYVISCVLIFIPYIIIAFSILLKRLEALFNIKNKSIIFIVTIISFILFPILHSTFIYGQPDIFGLAFVFLIISLIINYDFKKLEFGRLFILLLLTFMLLITRRWYLYFILSLYTCYAIWIIIKNIKDRTIIKSLKNIIIYLIFVSIFFIITMFPFFINVIKSNFGTSYAYYLTGGFKSEIFNQIKHIGYIQAFIMLLGIIYGIAKRNYRTLTILTILEYLLIILLFTRIQNMGIHHSLLLLPSYIFFIYLFIIFINKNKITYIIIITLFIINFEVGLSNHNTSLFTDVTLKTPIQEDYEEIKEVYNWLKNNLNENNKAYMITHNNTYNPDKFRNFDLPDKTVSQYLPYGSAILGTHMFPTDLFDATYIITTEPFVAVSLEGSYNKIFNQLVNQGKFELTKAFDMNNGIKIIIYKRIKEVDYLETQMYLQEIEQETENFKNLYEDVIQKYILDNNLNIN